MVRNKSNRERIGERPLKEQTMERQYQAVSVAVPSIPYPSLVANLLPELRQTEEDLAHMLEHIEQIPLWSAATINHEPLLQGIAETKERIHEWKNALSRNLQGQWIAATTEYNTYKSSVDQVLRKRHAAEIQLLFPALKHAEKASQLDPTQLMMMPEEERSVRHHLCALGFGYDKTSEGGNKRVTKLVKQQEKERSLFESTVQRHGDQLLAAKKSDVTRLQQEMKESEALLTAIVAAAESKVAAASRSKATALYLTKSQPHPPSAGRAAVPPSTVPQRGGVHSARSDRTQRHAVSPR